jgi:hypothetical protein
VVGRAVAPSRRATGRGDSAVAAKLEISKVHDAYAAGGECPLCALVEGAEESYLRSFQHSRVMEPNVRVKTNEQGFCPDHYRKLYQGENKLGLALVLHTHLQEKLPKLRDGFQEIGAGVRGGRKGKERLEAGMAALRALGRSCFICGLLESDLARYVFTVLYLWQKDPDFTPTFRASRGFCLNHFLVVLEKGRDMFSASELALWLADAVPLMTGSLEGLERDLFAFTQLHHDANRSLGTESERTALGRALQKLAGARFHL